MLFQNRIGKIFTVFMFFAVVMLIVSCGPKDRIAQGQLDTPEHHAYTGLKLLGEEKYADAQREFELAIQLDAKYSKGYTGIGLVKIYTGDSCRGYGWEYEQVNEEQWNLCRHNISISDTL